MRLAVSFKLFLYSALGMVPMQTTTADLGKGNMTPLPQDAYLDSLRDPAVRDLAWVIGAPVLPDAAFPAYTGRVVDDAWCRTQLQTCAPWLAALDSEPRSLHDFIAARPTRRLGHYFESLIAFWLAYLPSMQIIATNLQVKDSQRTLGEYDFLLRDASADICHWEAAVKFYLQAEPQAEQHVFIGPGARDRLDLKLDRVFSRQLKLGYTPAGREALPPDIALNKAQAFIKGYLFYPLTQTATTLMSDSNSISKVKQGGDERATKTVHTHGLGASEEANAVSPMKWNWNGATVPGISGSHLSGWWTRHPVAALPQTWPNTGWMILPRLRWLAPVRMDGDAIVTGNGVMTNGKMCEMLNQHFADSTESLLVVELKRLADHSWRETARGFVVHATWPQFDYVRFKTT